MATRYIKYFHLCVVHSVSVWPYGSNLIEWDLSPLGRILSCRASDTVRVVVESEENKDEDAITLKDEMSVWPSLWIFFMFGCLTFSLDGNIPSIRPRIRHHRFHSHPSLRQKESGRPIQHSAHVQCSPFIKEHHHSFLDGQTIVKSWKFFWPQFWQYPFSLLPLQCHHVGVRLQILVLPVLGQGRQGRRAQVLRWPPPPSSRGGGVALKCWWVRFLDHFLNTVEIFASYPIPIHGQILQRFTDRTPMKTLTALFDNHCSITANHLCSIIPNPRITQPLYSSN